MRRNTFFTTATALVAVLAFATLTTPDAQAGGVTSYETAFTQFQAALQGQSSAAEEAAAQWRELSAAQPADPVLRAYAGASTAMLANTTMLPWRKMSHAEDGLALIDKALAQLTPAHDAPAHRNVPASLETRFVAASTFLGLPSMFNRNARGAKLLEEVVTHPLLETAPIAFRATVWIAAGDAAAKAQRASDARQWLQKAASSGAPQAAAAQAKLKAL